ncbi:MAG: hypothetical protein R2684_12705 [Pyrinomonadaceae bacterium]
MKRTNRFSNLSLLFGALLMCLMAVSIATAQSEAVSTSGTSTASTPADSDSDSNFDVRSSIEFGVRGKKIEGDVNKYRSDLNYGAGVRIFDSTLQLEAKNKDMPFDSLLVTGSGWNADPNGFARISMEKFGWYRFDSSLRRLSYYNNLPNLADGEHTRNTKRNLGDFDLTLLPQNEKLKLRFGYSFNKQTGPGTTTFDYDRDEFPILANFDSNANDLRLGADAKIFGIDVSFTESYRRFEDRTSLRIDELQLGNNPSPNASLGTFSRYMPEDGTVWSSQLNLHKNIANRFEFTGRMLYSDSRVDFRFKDLLTGTDRSGNTINLDETNVEGQTKRPQFLGDFGVSFFVNDWVSISNTFSSNNYRITGANQLLQAVTRTTAGGTPLPQSVTNTAIYRFVNFKRITNTLEADFDVHRNFSFYAGYRYSKRQVDLNGIDRNLVSSSVSDFAEDDQNSTNTFIGGVKVAPVYKKWTIYADLEKGESDNVFTRLSNYNTTNFRLRNIFRPTQDLTANLTFQFKNNDNPSRTDTVPPTDFFADTKAKILSASLNWNPAAEFSLNGGFSHNRVDNETAVIFPAGGPTGQGFSRYQMRTNSFNIDAWFKPHKYVSGFAAYRIVKDNSYGEFFSAADFLIESGYPMSFQSPEARFTVRVTDNIDWNVGYQYYKYSEQVNAAQRYSAHLPYTSLRIYFGRTDR